jgi:hypothetical protein
MPSEMLHKVEVCEFSEPTMQVLEEMLRKVLAEKVSEPIMVGASKAGDLLGVSRTQFYNFRTKYPSLEGLALKLGDGDKLYWLVDDLKAWARRCATLRPGQVGPRPTPPTRSLPPAPWTRPRVRQPWGRRAWPRNPRRRSGNGRRRHDGPDLSGLVPAQADHVQRGDQRMP